MQEIFAEKTSTALEIVMEAEEPNLRVRKIVVLMFFIPFGTNYINPASANVSTMKTCY